MVLTMCCNITFPASRNRSQLNVYRCTSVHIESSWKMLTSTAEVKFPHRVKEFVGKTAILDLFQPGDPIVIELGYNNKFYTEFVGYIASVGTGVPVVLKCEDEMYHLRRKKISYSSKSTTLDQLIAAIAPGYERDVYAGVQLGKVRYSHMTVGQILEDVQKKTGFYSYFIYKKLVVGKIYADNTSEKPIKIDIERNAVSNALQNNNDPEKKIIVKAISINRGGKKKEVKIGEEGGDTVSLTYAGIELTTELKKTAMREYTRLKQPSLSGDITMFGIPRVKHGAVLTISSRIDSSLNGSYYIEKVTKDFSDDATYRQKVELGRKAK